MRKFAGQQCEWRSKSCIRGLLQLIRKLLRTSTLVLSAITPLFREARRLHVLYKSGVSFRRNIVMIRPCLSTSTDPYHSLLRCPPTVISFPTQRTWNVKDKVCTAGPPPAGTQRNVPRHKPSSPTKPKTTSPSPDSTSSTAYSQPHPTSPHHLPFLGAVIDVTSPSCTPTKTLPPSPISN